jgi:hypothetical protein
MSHPKGYKMKSLRKFLLAWMLFFISFLFAYSREIAKPAFYYLKVKIEPESGKLWAEGETNYIVRYYKGSLMLDDIRNKIGDRSFFKVCRDFYQKFHHDLIGTAEFREFWGDRLPEYKDLLNAWLDTRGGLPELK